MYSSIDWKPEGSRFDSKPVRILSSVKRLDWFCGHPIRNGGSNREGYSCRLSTRLLLVPNSSMSGAVSALSYKPLWRAMA